MADAIREVEDNVEATEAWNGPLFDVWIKYRDIVGEGVHDQGEAALAVSPPHEGDRVSTSAADLATRRCVLRASSAPVGTRTAWMSPSG